MKAITRTPKPLKSTFPLICSLIHEREFNGVHQQEFFRTDGTQGEVSLLFSRLKSASPPAWFSRTLVRGWSPIPFALTEWPAAIKSILTSDNERILPPIPRSAILTGCQHIAQ